MRNNVFIAGLIAALFVYGDVKAQEAGVNINPVRSGAFTQEVLLGDIVPEQNLAGLSHIYGPEQRLSWQIYVPQDYSPDNPPGVFVYISPSKKGSLPRGWGRVMSEKNYIYISMNGAGNKVPANQRILNALLAVEYVSANYQTDEARTLIAGFSGGARVASIIVESTTGIFEEAVFMGGAIKSQSPPEALAQKLGAGAYVFITGRQDQARNEMKATHAQYKKSGIKRLKFIDERNMGHDLPKAKILRRAIEFLSF